MFPVILELGPVKLHTYGFMIAVGFLIALYFIRRDAKTWLGLDGDTVNEMGFWILITGVLGTRVMHIVLYPQDYSWSNPLGWFALWQGGLVFQGALPTALAYYYWATRRHGVPFWRGLDVAFPYLCLAHAFGRVGCLMYGCCYGRPTLLPWGVEFPAGSPAWDGHLHEPGVAHTFPLHPTQLYSVVLLLALMAVLLLVRNRWAIFDGITVPVYMFLYGWGRFCLEFLRGDGNPRKMGAGLLTDQQVIALMMVAAGVVLFALLWRYAPVSESKEKTQA